jgi:hypothetical protein
MVLLGITNQEFLQHNSNRSYPLSERATKRPISGTADFLIPDNFLVAAKIVVNTTPNVCDISNFYIGRIASYNGGVLIEIYHNTGKGNIKVGTATAIDTGEFNTTFIINGLHTAGFDYGLTGHITVGTFEQMKGCLGDFTFDLAGGRFDPDVVQYSTASVTSVTVVSNGHTYAPIRGDIKLVAGKNVSLQAIQNKDQATEIHIHRQINEAEIPKCVKSINSVTPTEDGQIWFESATQCLKITDDANRIVVNETCSEPCCGCEEFETIVSSIENILQSITNMQVYQQQLEQQIQQLLRNLAITGA